MYYLVAVKCPGETFKVANDGTLKNPGGFCFMSYFVGRKNWDGMCWPVCEQFPTLNAYAQMLIVVKFVPVVNDY